MTNEMYAETMYIALQIAGVGLTVVFIALILITLLTSNFDRIDHWLHRSKTAEKAPPPVEAMPVVAEPAADGLSPEVMVAISAAIDAAISKKVRISRIRYRQAPAGSAWQVQGRTTIMGSRRTRQG